MWWLMFAAFAGAVLLAPAPSLSAARLRQVGLRPAARRPSLPAVLRARNHPRASAVLAGVAGALVGAAAGLATAGRPAALVVPAVAGTLLAVVGAHVLRVENTSRRVDREALAACQALACLADELRAGQRPGLALAAAAETAGAAAIAGVLGQAAATAALGGQVSAVLTEQAAVIDGDPAAWASLAGLGAAWLVSERTGAPLATVVERLADDLRSRYRQRQSLLAQLAGPRATAVLLSVLPAVGVLLAAGTGVRPVHILLGTPAGQVALLIGVCLDAVGALWCVRILAAASAEP
ncbi:MAG: tight adherence protein [Mycobacteriales bacterium]|jgi:tight adherence protein B